jgi:hypothetical protein
VRNETGYSAAAQSIGQGSALRPMTDPPAPVGGIEQHLREMDDQLESAHHRLALLANRLETACFAATPSGATQGKNEHIGSPIAERLRGQCMGVAALTARINDLLERIDL